VLNIDGVRVIVLAMEGGYRLGEHRTGRPLLLQANGSARFSSSGFPFIGRKKWL